jgi:hypothetical protein
MGDNYAIEVCRIVHDYDKQHQENRWWEARLITTEGEEVIYRINYLDERYKNSLGNFWREMFTLSTQKSHEEIKQSTLLFKRANAKLTALLLQDGWEPFATNDNGMVTMMKRSKIK